MKKVLILEGKSDQAKALNEFLSNHYDLTLIDDVKGTNYEDYDIVVPTGAKSTMAYLQENGDIKIGNIVFTKNNLQTYDKVCFLDFVKQIGVPIPVTYLSKDEIIAYPVFYKSKREEGYAYRGILRNAEEAANFDNQNVFFQEFIWSKGTYGVAFIADRGKVISHFTQYEVLSYPYHGGSGVILERVDDKRLINYTEKIVKEANYSGWGLIEFKYSYRIEDFVFMEVNAKMWASIKFAFMNNPDFLKILFDIDIKPANVERIFYIDRFILSEWLEIKKYLRYLLNSKIVHSKPIVKTIIDRIKGNRIRAQRVRLMK